MGHLVYNVSSRTARVVTQRNSVSGRKGKNKSIAFLITILGALTGVKGEF